MQLGLKKRIKNLQIIFPIRVRAGLLPVPDRAGAHHLPVHTVHDTKLIPLLLEAGNFNGWLYVGNIW